MIFRTTRAAPIASPARALLIHGFAAAVAACGSQRVPVADGATNGAADGQAILDGSARREQGARETRPSTDEGPQGEARVDGGPDADPDAAGDAAASCSGTPVGQHCADDSVCGEGFCIKTSSAAVNGVCSCSCQPDDPRTPARNEDTCPDGDVNLCAALPRQPPGLPPAGCLQRCVPRLGGSDCPAGLACRTDTSGLARSPDLSVCLYPACADDYDCAIVTATLCDPLQNTDVAGSNPACTGPGGRCITVVPGPAPAGRCVMPGDCEPLSGLCRSRVNRPGTFSSTALIGDPCADDTQCGAAQTCWPPSKNGNGDLVARNGYCVIVGCAFAGSVPHVACDTQSSCLRLGSSSICFRNCALEDTAGCRGHAADHHGDYECYGWSNFNQPNLPPLAVGPVCMPATMFSCGDLQSSQLGCNALGVLPGNPTQMACRRLDGTPTLNPFDPTGYCLDTTGSGP